MSGKWSQEGLLRLLSAVDPTPVPAERSGCCDEANCRRKHPIGIYRGDFTGQVYAATAMRLVNDHGDGTGTFAATTKHDVTEQMRRFMKANRLWVLEVLGGDDT